MFRTFVSWYKKNVCFSYRNTVTHISARIIYLCPDVEPNASMPFPPAGCSWDQLQIPNKFWRPNIEHYICRFDIMISASVNLEICTTPDLPITDIVMPLFPGPLHWSVFQCIVHISYKPHFGGIDDINFLLVDVPGFIFIGDDRFYVPVEYSFPDLERERLVC